MSVQSPIEQKGSTDEKGTGAFIVDMDDVYVANLIVEEVAKKKDTWVLYKPSPTVEDAYCISDDGQTLQDGTEKRLSQLLSKGRTFFCGEYERVLWDDAYRGRLSTIWYMNRKGLTRKANMAASIQTHVSKCPTEIAFLKKQKEDEKLRQKEEESDDDSDDDDSDSDSDSDDDSSDEEDSACDDEESDATSAETEPEPEPKSSPSSPSADTTTPDESKSANDDAGAAAAEDVGSVFQPSDRCCLAEHTPETYYFEIRDPDEIDELLICDLPEINALDEHSEEENLRTGNMWILKPSLTNQGKGISVVASLDGLRECLTAEGATDMSEWVAQRYIPNPLLMGGGRKFHIRCYVLAVGSLTVYMSTGMLALFSLVPFDRSDASAPPSMHITNSCYQKGAFVPPPGCSDVEFDEKMVTLLLDEALEGWASEHIDYEAAAAKQTSETERKKEEEVPSAIKGSRAAFKYFKHKASNASDTDGEKPLAKSVAAEAFQHLCSQMQSILAELYGGCAGVHDTAHMTVPADRPCCDGTGHQTEDDDSNEKDRKKKGPRCTARPPAEADAVASRAGSSVMMSQYVPMANCAELYGFDFLVDETFKVWLLEANPGPDFGQTGARLKAVVCQPLVRGMVSLIEQTLFAKLNIPAPVSSHELAGADAAAAAAVGVTRRPRLPTQGQSVWGLPAAEPFVPVYHADLPRR